jgi:AAT family amino acid transporter
MTAGNEALASPDQAPEAERVPRFGAATPVLTTVGLMVVSVVSWWLLADPEWSVVGAQSATPEEAARDSAVVAGVLFWVILAHIWTGFNFGTWPFSKLPQPLAGVAHVASNVVIGLIGLAVFTRGVGSWDDTFSASTPGGAGYTAAAFIVLIGFWAFTIPSANLGNYPFDEVEGPLNGVGAWLLGAFLTTVGVVTLIYPNFNATLAADPPVSLPTVVGWIYSSIVVIILGAQVWQNAHLARIPNRHARAAAALVLSLAGGFLVMLVLEQVLHLILPSYVDAAADFPIRLETAQLGVCIVLIAILSGLIFTPREDAGVGSRAIRTAVVVVVGIAVYMVFMRFFATAVLHFPAIKGSYGGNPLQWVNWAILVVLWHVVAFGGHFSTRNASRS